MDTITTINIPEQTKEDLQVKVETPERLVDISNNIRKVKVGIERNRSIEHRKNYTFLSDDPRFILYYFATDINISNPTTCKHIVHTKGDNEHIVYETNKLLYAEHEINVIEGEPAEYYVRIETTFDMKRV